MRETRVGVTEIDYPCDERGVWVGHTFPSGPQFWGMWARAHAIVSPLLSVHSSRGEGGRKQVWVGLASKL